MMTMSRMLDARQAIGRLLAPRREIVRREVLRILLAAQPRDAAGRRAAMGLVHDLCAKELAERVRLAAAELLHAYRGGPAVASARVFDEVKLEIEQVVREEASDLTEDELLAAALVTGLRQFVLDNHSPGAAFAP